MTTLTYELLKPVSRSGSLLSAIFGLIGCAVKILSRLFFFAPLLVLGGAHYLRVFSAEQLHALALLLLRLDYHAETIAMVFFGFQCLLMGCLIVRSTFLPRILGVLLAIGGSSYVISSFANFLAPAFGARLAPFILPAALVGEGSLTVWLLVIGVNVQRWNERARMIHNDTDHSA